MSYCAHCGSETAPDARFCPSCGKPPSGAPGVRPGMNPVAIIAIVVGVVLGGVMMLGIIAAIAIPNLLNAIDRGKQKRTMADLRSIGTASEAYAVDNDHYPIGNLRAVERVLEPVYIKNMPLVDGWNGPIDYDGPAGGVGYTVKSWGKDAQEEGNPLGQATHDFDCDIIFIDGKFTQWPEGMQ